MKKSFTILELIFVIVIIGILTSVILPRTQTNSLEQAANQVIAHIRYTQHLAMVDDRYDVNDNEWYKEKWQFIYGKSNSSSRDTGGYYAYSIFSDNASGHTSKPDTSEMAKNPLNKEKYLSGGYSGTLDWENQKATKKLNIGYSYGIDNITYSGCSGKRIAFDYLGRSFIGADNNWDSSIDGILKKQCQIILHKGNKSISIYIEKETGYIHL